MGNVNGREDGSSSPSGVEEEEEESNSVHEAMAAPMGHSPPHSHSFSSHVYSSRTLFLFFLKQDRKSVV